MSSTGLLFPTLGTSVSYGSWAQNDWTSPTFLYSDDVGSGSASSVTAATFDAGDRSFVLKATGFNFSSIPTNVTIDGVICTANAWWAVSTCSVDFLMLLDTTKAPAGSNQCATPVALTTSMTGTISKGGSTDTWNNSLTQSWVSDTGFGVGIGILAGSTGNSNNDVWCDCVALNVFYTILPITPSVLTTVAGKVNPTVVLGNTTATPSTLVSIAGIISPTVVIAGGGITVTPSALASIGTKVNPTIVLGSLTLTPVVLPSVAGKVNPVTILGSISFTPSALASITGIVAPTVVVSGGNITVTPAALATIANKVEPTIVLGSIISIPAVIVVISAKGNPVIVLGSITITPVSNSVVSGKVNPVVGLGSVVVTPASLLSVAGSVAPNVLIVTPSVSSGNPLNRLLHKILGRH